MKAVYILFAALIVLMLGCAESFKITNKAAGGYKNEQIISASKIKVKGNSARDFETVYLEYYCSKSDSGTVYSFIFEAISLQWLNIQHLELDIDGMITEHEYDRLPIVDARDVRGINEKVSFTLNKNKIIDIIEIRDCTIKLVGEARTIEIDMRTDWINKLEQFYDETLK